MTSLDLDVIKEIPGYKIILKAVLKSQIQQLVEQLAAHTDEESVILTASVSDGSSSHLGTISGKSFLDDNADIKSQFLGFCIRRYHKEKQEEKERQEQEEAMHNLPTQVPQFEPRFTPRSPRFPLPRQQGVFPVTMSRASPGSGIRSTGIRQQPYSRPMKRPSNFEARSQGPSPKMSQSGHVIKVEAEDLDYAESSNVQSGSSQPTSPSQANAETNPTAPSFKTESSEDDARSNSSASTIPNESSELRQNTGPAEGLSLDSDLSSLLPKSESSEDNNLKTNTPKASHTHASNLESDPIKFEAITEAEMELEITGVEPGAQTVQPGTSQESWGEDVTGVAKGYSGQGATGNQGDIHPGYTPMVDQDQLYSQQTYTEKKKQLKRSLLPCEICGKMFPYKSHLTMHMRIHTGEKPFQCTFCKKTFNQKSHLKSHLVVHVRNLAV